MNQNRNDNVSNHEENAAKTPLETVREQQAMKQQSREVLEQRPDHSPEVPGTSSPSNMRKHPQRRLG